MEAEPFFVRHAEAQRLLGVGESHYYDLIKRGKIKVVGRGRLSRALYSSVKAYVAKVVAEAEAKVRGAGLAIAPRRNEGQSLGLHRRTANGEPSSATILGRDPPLRSPWAYPHLPDLLGAGRSAMVPAAA